VRGDQGEDVLGEGEDEGGAVEVAGGQGRGESAAHLEISRRYFVDKRASSISCLRNEFQPLKLLSVPLLLPKASKL
jgi:hypothetical protein